MLQVAGIYRVPTQIIRARIPIIDRRFLASTFNILRIVVRGAETLAPGSIESCFTQAYSCLSDIAQKSPAGSLLRA
jgi:hypothetical protein